MTIKKILQARVLKVVAILTMFFSLTGCDPQVYGSIGVSSSFGSYSGSRYGSSPRMHGSISIGGRIR